MMPISPPSLPDILSSDLDPIFCGINPGLCAAATGHHFMSRSNRFWRAIDLSGLSFPRFFVFQRALPMLPVLRDCFH
jgi:double-stranded uracil-DNA glycosylase